MKYIVIFFTSFLCFSQTNLQKTWSTYYFGNSSNLIDSVVDNDGNVVVVGFVRLPENFDYYNQFTTVNCYQKNIYSANTNFKTEGFVAKFSPLGLLLWSSYFGGEGTDGITKITVDNNNNYYFVGNTMSYNNIATQGSYISSLSSINITTGFLAKFSSSGNRLWCTYIPGNISDLKFYNNALYLGGQTITKTNLATSGVYNETLINYDSSYIYGNNYYPYVMKFDLQGNRLFGTYLDKTCPVDTTFDQAFTINFDSFSNLIVTFNLSNINLSSITTPSCHQSNFGGGNYDGFIMKLSADFTQKIWGTYFGGSGDDLIKDVKITGDDIYIVGYTKSVNNISTLNSFQPNITNTSLIEGFYN